MPRFLVLVLGVLLGAALTVVGIVVVRTAVGSTGFAVDEHVLACNGGAGQDEVCVVRSSRPELLVVPGQQQLQVRRTGVPRMLVADDPWGTIVRTDLEVDFSDGVTVSDRSRSLTWTQESVDSLLTD